MERKNIGSLIGIAHPLFVDMIAIPASMAPSCARYHHLASGGILYNALCWGANMALGGLHRMLLETTPS